VTATLAEDGFAARFRALQRAQKRRKGVPLYTLCVNRPVGRAIAAASPAGVTPNALTAVGAVLTYGGLVWLLLGVSGPPAALVGLALVVGFFFDSADGQLARLRRSGSLRGEWLDHLLDSGRIALQHVATLWFLLGAGVAPAGAVVAVCSAFLVFSVLKFFGGILFDHLASVDQTKVTPQTGGSWSRSVLMLPLDYGVLCLCFLLLPWPHLFAAVYALLGLAMVLSTGAFCAAWYRRLASLDADRARA
jgi:phosphatidylglycerophosphate synthase